MGDDDHERKDAREQKPAPKGDAKLPPNASAGEIEEHKAKLLERLKAFFEEHDVDFEDGWRVEVKQRTGGNSAGTTDAYYFNPENKRYRSRAEIARDHGIKVDKVVRANTKKPVVLLSRDEAMAKAKEHASEAVLPLKLGNGVTIVSFGTPHSEHTTSDDLVMVGYSAEYTDDKGIKFVSSVIDTEHGPYYKISATSAAKGESSESPAETATPMEVGSGPTPDAAWQVVAERQQEILEVGKKPGAGEGEAEASVSPEGATAASGEHEHDAMEPGDHLLLQAAPLTGCWGLERFGLADISCLQALEGQHGVEDTKYLYVEERTSWDEESRHLLRESARHGKGSSHGVSGRSRSRQPRSQEEREAQAVQRVMDGMIRQLEAGEVRAAAAEHRALMKRDRELQRMLEKEQRRLTKEREREVARQIQEKQREIQRAAAIEAARTEEDETLPTAHLPPPMPHPIGAGKLPPACEPTLLEAWHLLRRFSKLLGIDPTDMPSLTQLEAALMEGPGTSPKDDISQLDICSRMSVAVLDFLVTDLYSATVKLISETNPDVRESDLRPNAKTLHPVPITCDTWQEVARRYLALASGSATAWHKDGGSGLPYPTNALDPYLVLQFLTAGPPSKLNKGPVTLPRGAASGAWVSMMARSDAEALVAAIGGTPSSDTTEGIQVQRVILMELSNTKGDKGKNAELLCFQGQAAAAAVKFGRPSDLRTVAARVDAGVYMLRPDSLTAFAADVAYVCALHQTAANKGATEFAAENAEQGIAEVAAMVLSKMEAAVTEVKQDGAAAFLAKHLPFTAETGDGGDADANTADAAPSSTPAILDLSRPFSPWGGCGVCWSDEDSERMMICTGCASERHTYCVDLPIDEAPSGGWTCPACCASGVPCANAAPAEVKFAPGSDGQSFWCASERLATKDYATWTPEERVSLLGMLSTLLGDSPALRDRLLDEEADLRDMRKELFAKRNELKQRQLEESNNAAGIAEPPQAQPEGAAAEGAGGAIVSEEAARPSARRAREIASEIETIVKRISELEHQADQVQPQRLDPLGMDRHWNRYWVLPAAALGAHVNGQRPAAVVVERHRVDSMEQGRGAGTQQIGAHDWQVGVYRAPQAISKLLAWINPKGVRERVLNSELRRISAEMERVQRELAASGNGTPGGAAGSTPSSAAAAMDVDGGAETSVERLRAALLDFESGLLNSARDPRLGNAVAMDAWKVRVAEADTPKALMAALVVLETAIVSDYLKSHWRPWAMPAPHPDDARTMASVWLRFDALKAATKNKVTLRITPRDVLGGRYPLRDQSAKAQEDEAPPARRPNKRVAADSGASDSDGSAGAHRRAERASKRSRAGEGEDDDEALARQLDAELNARDRPMRTSRLRHEGGRERDGSRSGSRYRDGGKKNYAEDDDEWDNSDGDNSEVESEGAGGGGRKRQRGEDSEEEYRGGE